jgi:hypothetical protein
MEIQKRHLMSITHFTCEKKADVGEWYTKLGDEQKELMQDKSAPSGEGYIFTLNGMHWHDGNDFQDRRSAYVLHTLIANLQKPTIERDGYPVRDVRRLGISHPVIVAHQTASIPYDPLGEQKKRQMSTAGGVSRFGQPLSPFSGPGASSPFAPPGSGLGGTFAPRPVVPGQPGAGTAGENVKMIDQTDFTVQFVLKPIVDPAKRPTAEELASQVSTPATTAPPSTPAAQTPAAHGAR